MPFDTCLHYEVPPDESALVWQSLGEGGAFITRQSGEPFVFAAPTDEPPTLKVDAERLGDHQEIVDRLVGLYAMHPCVQEAGALSLVPNGMADFAGQLGRYTGKDVIGLFRPDGAPRSDMRFISPDDETLALQVSTVCVVEDVSRIGFSAHAAAKVLRDANPGLDVHTLSMLQRDVVDPAYTEEPGGIHYHTFVRQYIPLSVEEFRRQFPNINVETVL